jgi:hypothetical protein
LRLRERVLRRRLLMMRGGALFNHHLRHQFVSAFSKRGEHS